MITSITKQFRFEAAHSLPHYEGKCKNLHGHSYFLEVTISGSIQTSGSCIGMVMDFSDVSKIVEKEIVGQWDHQFLNDILSFNTTCENLATECFSRLEKAGLPVSKIKLLETSKCFVEVCK